MWPAVAVAGVCVPHTVLLHRLWLLVATRCQDGPCMQCMQVLVGSRGVTLIQSFRQEISQSTHGRTLHVLQLEWRAAKFTLVILLGECSRTSPQKKEKKMLKKDLLLLLSDQVPVLPKCATSFSNFQFFSNVYKRKIPESHSIAHRLI